MEYFRFIPQRPRSFLKRSAVIMPAETRLDRLQEKETAATVEEQKNQHKASTDTKNLHPWCRI